MALLFKFINYGTEHFAWLFAGLCSVVFWVKLGQRQRDDLGQRRVGLAMSLIPALWWTAVSLWMALFERPPNLNLVLPFHVCYAANLLLPLMLWWRSYALFEVLYFVVMAGCIQALLTPDLQTNFPERINLRYFIVHIGLVQSVLYAVWVFGFRPQWRGLLRAVLWMNLYFLAIIPINMLLGTNFMFLRQKPPSPNLLDLFGPWPWYILGAEMLGVLLFVVVLLPFLRYKKF
jgi:hypothetical integral membrane protein (TIGR02206 family)